MVVLRYTNQHAHTQSQPRQSLPELSIIYKQAYPTFYSHVFIGITGVETFTGIDEKKISYSSGNLFLISHAKHVTKIVMLKQSIFGMLLHISTYHYMYICTHLLTKWTSDIMHIKIHQTRTFQHKSNLQFYLQTSL